MRNKGLIATIVVLIAVIITLITVVILMQMPTIMSVDGIASKFLNTNKETTIVSTIEVVSSVKETETTIVPVSKKSTKIEDYNGYNNHVSISYPQIEGMEDLDLQEKINEKIKTNALSIVPLYPISTALQNLNVSCEVRRFDDSYITIIYEGRVVGNTAKSKTSSGTQNKTGNKKATGGRDPYLDGFVDPLAGYNQFNQFNQFNIVPTSAFSYSVETTARRNVEIGRASQNFNGPSPNSKSGTEDKGPTVTTIPRPTAAAHSSSYIENMATNNPIYSINNQNSGGSRINSAPTDSNIVKFNYPVSGHTSVSTVDQKVFYTNTIDLRTGRDVTLSDYVLDLEKLSRWVRSSKVEFTNIDENDIKKVREYVNLTVQTRYLDQMKNADFRNKGLSQWPKIFSYSDEDGIVYFSVKLSSKLGNYAIVKYKP